MDIYVNSKQQEVPDGARVIDLITILDLSNKRVAIEVNTDLVVKTEWAGRVLKAGDRVEIVSFVGGG